LRAIRTENLQFEHRELLSIAMVYVGGCQPITAKFGSDFKLVYVSFAMEKVAVKYILHLSLSLFCSSIFEAF
jgi:hypothetical protein